MPQISEFGKSGKNFVYQTRKQSFIQEPALRRTPYQSQVTHYEKRAAAGVSDDVRELKLLVENLRKELNEKLQEKKPAPSNCVIF